MGSQIPGGPEEDFVVGGDNAQVNSSDKDKAGKRTKGSTDDPSGTSSSDKKKVKKGKSKKNKDPKQNNQPTPDGDLL